MLDGVSFVTQYIAEGLAKKKWDVTVITTRYNSKKKFELYNRVKIYRKDFYTKKTFHLGNQKEYFNFINSFSKEKFIFINVGLQNVFTDWILQYMDSKKFYSILYLHGIYSADFNINDFITLKNFVAKIFRNLRWFFYIKFNQKYFKRYSFLIHLHKNDKSINFFERLGIKNKLILENVVDKNIYKLKEKKIESFSFISIGSFNYRKNQIRLLKCFIKANIKNSLLILIGNNGKEYYNLLLHEKKKYKGTKIYKKIKIFYNLPRKKTLFFIKKANIFLMASTWEAYPISILECMSMGIPFITTNVGILSYLPGGIIVKNDLEMINAMRKLATDKKLLKKLSADGYKYAKKKFNIMDKVNLLELKLNKIAQI